MYAKTIRPNAKREVEKERSATIKSRALGALKLASAAFHKNVASKRADFDSCFLAQNGRGLFDREESNLSIYEIKKGT